MIKYFYTGLLGILISAFVMAQPPKQAVALYQKGLTLEESGRVPEAIVAYKKAISLYKKYDSAYIHAGLAYVKASKPDSGVMILKTAVKLNPAFTDAYLAMGNIYRDVIKRPDDAIENYLKAVKIDSTNKVTYYSLAWCNNAKEYYREAVKYGVKALEIDNDYKPAYNELGHAYRQLKAYEEGIAQFKKNLAISTNDLPMLYIGYCYMELNQKDKALEMYEELKKINEKMAGAMKKRLDAMK
ncbi:tetratricopeptide repeat protein [Ferruginibacter sp. SUN106]|uniref:tetratricopeptide repeat protein n=1 Tax=Ferruginibacter sp. SUN106 TaxID=2978348 RepID=UPI003D36256E